VTFNTSDVAENMKKFGGFIPGIRPGQRTAEYIDRVLSRITLAGAIYVAVVHPAHHPHPAVQRALLFRRHGAVDRGRRGTRHGAQIETHLPPAATKASCAKGGCADGGAERAHGEHSIQDLMRGAAGARNAPARESASGHAHSAVGTSGCREGHSG
jgi:hypothetical protein